MKTYVIQELHRHLDIGGLTSDNHQSLALASSRRRRTVHAHTHRPRLHNLDLACTHVPNLIDLSATLADDTSHEIVRDVNLLRLQLLWRTRVRGPTPTPTAATAAAVRVGVAGNIRRPGVWRPARVARRSVRRVRVRRHPLVRLNQDIANVICSDVYSVSDS